MSLVVKRNELKEIRSKLKAENKKVVFTNGCFDILHAGHVDYLNKAKEFGDILIVALNSDKSVARIKGEKRPIVNQTERSFIIENLKSVDYVTFFEEDTPKEIIDDLIPDILVKGADWAIENIVGRDTVEKNGGSVETIKFINFQSTTNIIDLIRDKYKD
ncbi:MAG: D-glycero-beta-D-manno-heptose 1-phosphate adenylyltransferase [Melioribacteraceae bacterium]|nr:D-glycero-beta-D-manno-heptose 1-phosphate adenylyltransferase [Melioribacteraceae bacterium]